VQAVATAPTPSADAAAKKPRRLRPDLGVVMTMSSRLKHDAERAQRRR
jgi:hypothetical protein